MRETVAQYLRGLMRSWCSARSLLVLTWYRALFPGLAVGRGVRLGKGVQIAVLRGATLTISDRVTVEEHCKLVSQGTLSIGADSFIGAGTIIVAAERVTVGRDALIAAYATIRDQNHRLDRTAVPFSQQGLISAPIDIDDNVWIGTKATILKGVHIGRDAVIGAHALVTDDVDACSVVGGVPARLLRKLVPVQSEGRA